MINVYCFRSGQIVLAHRKDEPKGALLIYGGGGRGLRDFVNALARHAYDGKTLLVPCLPEAETEDAAILAVNRFASRIEWAFERREQIAWEKKHQRVPA